MAHFCPSTGCVRSREYKFENLVAFSGRPVSLTSFVRMRLAAWFTSSATEGDGSESENGVSTLFPVKTASCHSRSQGLSDFTYRFGCGPAQLLRSSADHLLLHRRLGLVGQGARQAVVTRHLHAGLVSRPYEICLDRLIMDPAYLKSCRVRAMVGGRVVWQHVVVD